MYENENDVKALVDMYPDDPSEGSPYNTGDELFGQEPEYKREASIYNDLIFTVRRLFIFIPSSCRPRILNSLYRAFCRPLGESFR